MGFFWFRNKQKRIDAIAEIALAWIQNVFDNIEPLIRNNNGFSLEQIMNFTPQVWLNNHNKF